MGLVILLSCGDTKLIKSWRDSAYEGKYLKNVLVVGLSDPFERGHLFEDTFVANLQQHGVNAVAFTSLSQNKSGTLREAKITAAKRGDDTILAVRLVKMSMEEVEINMVPPPMQTEDMDTEYLMSALDRSTKEYNTKRHIVMQSTLYNADTGKAIWRSRSETIDPASLNAMTMIDSLSRTVIKRLRADKLIQ